MKCPFCGCEETQVKDSRNTEDNTSVRRRRECPECGSRFTTFERVQLRELISKEEASSYKEEDVKKLPLLRQEEIAFVLNDEKLN